MGSLLIKIIHLSSHLHCCHQLHKFTSNSTHSSNDLLLNTLHLCCDHYCRCKTCIHLSINFVSEWVHYANVHFRWNFPSHDHLDIHRTMNFIVELSHSQRSTCSTCSRMMSRAILPHLNWYFSWWIDWWWEACMFDVMLVIIAPHKYPHQCGRHSHTEVLFNRLFIMQCSMSFYYIRSCSWWIKSTEQISNEDDSEMILSSVEWWSLHHWWEIERKLISLFVVKVHLPCASHRAVCVQNLVTWEK